MGRGDASGAAIPRRPTVLVKGQMSMSDMQAQQQQQMTAGSTPASRAVNETERAYTEQPAVQRRGLDTGARGWRWLTPRPGAGRAGPTSRAARESGRADLGVR